MNLEEFKSYHPGDILNLHWNRGNGELDVNYLLCGFNKSNIPLLINYSASHSGEICDGNPVFFDVQNLQNYIEKVERISRLVNLEIISKILKHSRIN